MTFHSISSRAFLLSTILLFPLANSSLVMAMQTNDNSRDTEQTEQPSDNQAVKDESANGQSSTDDQAPNHRIDFTAIFINGITTESLDGLVTYTHNVDDNSNVSLSLPYKDPDLNKGGDSGVGDIIFAYSFVPSLIIDSNPWIPNTLGSGVAILAPTGEAKYGRSLDTWIVAPFLGYAFPINEHFFIAPQVSYIHSIGKIITGNKLKLVAAEVGFSFIDFYGFWASYYPALTRDLVSEEWSMNHRVSIGTMITKHSGISIDITRVERFNFGSPLPKQQSGFDEQIDLNIHFTF